jgi:cell division transport system permease protein
MLYHLRQAWLAMHANLIATLATLTTMTLTLTILGVVGLVILNLNTLVQAVERDVKIAVFLEDIPELAADLAVSIQDKERFPDVASVVFISKDQAWQNLSASYSYLKKAKDLIDNPLSDELEVTLASSTNIAAIAKSLSGLEGVKDVRYGQEYVATIIRVIEVVRVAGIALVVLLLINSLANILNTIRVAMYARRDEINVMRLLGATRGFIRMPYVLEGVVLGLLAGALTAVLIYPAYMTGSLELQRVAPFLPINREERLVWLTVAVLAGIGVGIGLFGSLFATNRYLREVE